MTYKSQAKPRAVDAQGRELGLCHNCIGASKAMLVPVETLKVRISNGRRLFYCEACWNRRKRMKREAAKYRIG